MPLMRVLIEGDGDGDGDKRTLITLERCKGVLSM